jgi:hypothetical protein
VLAIFYLDFLLAVSPRFVLHGEADPAMLRTQVPQPVICSIEMRAARGFGVKIFGAVTTLCGLLRS